MGIYQRKDSPYWWLCLEREKLPPLRLPTKIRKDAPDDEARKKNKHLAQVAYHAGMTELAKGTLQPEKTTTPRLRVYWSTVYLPWLTQHYPKAVGETTRVMETLFLPTMGDKQLSEIRPGLIKTWIDGRTVTPQSKVRELSHLRGLLSRAVEWEHLARHPLAGLSLDAAPSREIVRYLTAAEEARLLQALTARDAEARAARERVNRHRLARRKPPLPAIETYGDALHPMVVLSLQTGMRRGEVFQACWPAVDWQARVLTVEWWTAKRSRRRAIKSRRLRLNTHAHTALTTWWTERGKPDTGLIFPSHTGERFTNVDSSWTQVLKTAGIQHFRWHDLRHTFASKLVQRGIDLYVVQRLLGHASISTTMKYAHLGADPGHAAMDALDT